MARLTQHRFDFRGGVNTQFSEDVLDLSELTEAQNARMDRYGSIEKRAGTQRVHTDQLASGADVMGLFQWDAPSASGQVVAVAGGNLYHKTLAGTTFTEVASSLSTTQRAIFAVHHISGTPTLYFADGALRKWTGSALTTSISGAPDATFIRVYKTRLFACDGTKTIYWSKIDDPETWASPDGGQANVETYDSEGVVAMAVVGSALLLFKEDSTARFVGTTASTIRIDQETEGVSNEIGCIAPGTVVELEGRAFFLSARGPMWAYETHVEPIGVKIEAELDDWSKSAWGDAWAVHHKDRREIWLFVPGSGQTENTVLWIYNYRTQSWWGPSSFSSQFNASVAAEYELSDGTHNLLVGGYDGWIRQGDVEGVGAKDDVTNGGTGGTAITMQVTLPVLFFGDVTRFKSLHPTQWVQADLGAAGSLQIITSSEAVGSKTLTITTDGSGMKKYKFRPALRGHRPTLTFKEATSEIVRINGVTLTAELGRRVA